MDRPSRHPLAFWFFALGLIWIAMTVLWAFGDEPTGTVLVLAIVLWWGSGLALIALGLIALSRRWRASDERQSHSPL